MPQRPRKIGSSRDRDTERKDPNKYPSLAQDRYKELVDLSFLPENHIKRINEIFDSYFNLGMKKRTELMEVDIPRFPSKISTLNSPELGDILSHYTAWYSYASDKFKYIAVATTYMEQEMQSILDRELGEQVADKGNIETKKSKARSSEMYTSLKYYYQKLSGLKILLDGELYNYDKCIASLSREVSRREQHGGY